MTAPRLLDTNSASHIIKGTRPSVDRWLLRVPLASLFISTVTEAGLRYGVARLPAAIRLAALVEEFLLMVTILPWDSEAARRYGSLRAKLENDSSPMANLDMMIGALALRGVLVTNDNVFHRVKGLKVEDWTKS